MRLAALAIVGLSIVGASALGERAEIVQAAPCAPAHSFAIGELLTAANMNANPQKFAQCFNNLDNTNIGAAGIYANQIQPTTVGQATFGGTVQYAFTSGVTMGGNLVVNNGVFDTPSGTPGQFCSGANCLVVQTNGNTSVPIDFSVGRNAAVTGFLQANTLNSIGNLTVNNGVVTTGGPLQLCSAANCINMTTAGNVSVPNAFSAASTISTPANISAGTDVSVGRNLGVTGAVTVNASSGYIVRGSVGTYPYDSGTYAPNDHIERGGQSASAGQTIGGYNFKVAYASPPTCVVSAVGAQGNSSAITAITTTYVQWVNSVAAISAQVICVGA